MSDIFEREIWTLEELFTLPSFDRYLIVTFRNCELKDDGDLYTAIMNKYPHLREYEEIDYTISAPQRFSKTSFMQDPSTSVDILSVYSRMGGSDNYESGIEVAIESVKDIMDSHKRVFLEMDYNLDYYWLDIIDKKFNFIVE